MHHSLKSLASSLLLLMLLGACSGNVGNDANDDTEKSSEPTVSSAFPRTLEDANGDFTLDKAPQKVAIAHWGFVDSFLLFDTPSAAVVLPFSAEQSVLKTDVYEPYVETFDELEVVGENQQVNLEALLAYEPDLIIAGNQVNEDIDQLQQIAPVFVVDEEEVNVWGDWPALVSLFGDILGQEDVAESFIRSFEQKVEEGREKVANIEGEVAFLQAREATAWLQGTNYLPLYYDQLGLSVPDASIMEEGAEISLEGISELNPDHLFIGYFQGDSDSSSSIIHEWEETNVWNSLQAVEKGQVYEMNGELALGYGPIGQSYGLDQVVQALE
ncbi:Fe3+-siderophore ABC transporter substrate-binding protein [Shouchella clausii KSM-K16]|uniref:Fe3+-siderophore ABC transporter substrate-binding protein n=1 Tax=Shouchella clausii (strain KSM-K16) TaxID=66692 RepID=Q5WDQ9_SHOC1|nr:Fe3+-siderophore ABC transporter substrate-binding protein [Shouchella clausii KSM-K16]